jgi:transcriptional regulator with XRE-family HTH domain
MDGAPATDLGRRLREVRRAQGLTRSEVARSAGLTWRELAAYERGRVAVPDSDLWCLAGSCGVDVSALTDSFGNGNGRAHRRHVPPRVLASGTMALAV